MTAPRELGQRVARDVLVELLGLGRAGAAARPARRSARRGARHGPGRAGGRPRHPRSRHAWGTASRAWSTAWSTTGAAGPRARPACWSGRTARCAWSSTAATSSEDGELRVTAVRAGGRAVELARRVRRPRRPGPRPARAGAPARGRRAAARRRVPRRAGRGRPGQQPGGCHVRAGGRRHGQVGGRSGDGGPARAAARGGTRTACRGPTTVRSGCAATPCVEDVELAVRARRDGQPDVLLDRVLHVCVRPDQGVVPVLDDPVVDPDRPAQVRVPGGAGRALPGVGAPGGRPGVAARRRPRRPACRRCPVDGVLDRRPRAGHR